MKTTRILVTVKYDEQMTEPRFIRTDIKSALAEYECIKHIKVKTAPKIRKDGI